MMKNLALSVLVLGLVSAGATAQPRAAASVQPRAAAAGQYNPGAERDYAGVVTGVISVVAPDGTVGVHLTLKTEAGTVQKVHLGPAIFIGMNNFSFFADDRIVLTGAPVTHDGETALWARQVSKDGKTIALRNADGTPKWSSTTADDDGCGVTHEKVRD